MIYDNDKRKARMLKWTYNATTDGEHIIAFSNLADMLINDFQQLDLSPTPRMKIFTVDKIIFLILRTTSQASCQCNTFIPESLTFTFILTTAHVLYAIFRISTL